MCTFFLFTLWPRRVNFFHWLTEQSQLKYAFKVTKSGIMATNPVSGSRSKKSLTHISSFFLEKTLGCVKRCSSREKKQWDISYFWWKGSATVASEVQRWKVATSCAKAGKEKSNFIQMSSGAWKQNNNSCVDSRREHKKEQETATWRLNMGFRINFGLSKVLIFKTNV